MDKIGVSHTRKVMFRTCKRMHAYRYIERAVPKRQAVHLEVGTLMHAWLEAWMTAMIWPEFARNFDGMPKWITSTPQIWGDPDDIKVNVVDQLFGQLDASAPYEAARLRAMVLAYHLRWSSGGWGVLEVEREIWTPLINPSTGRSSPRYMRNGRIDAIVDDDGSKYVVEHKSRSGGLDPDDGYWTQLRMDPQISDYVIGARMLGHEIDGVIYDVVCKPKIEPRKATPVEDRKMTVGQKCKICRGDATIGGSPCSVCSGTGWKEPPRYHAVVRLLDETPGQYGERCFLEIISAPERYLHRRKVVRLADEIREHELDDWHTVQDLDEDRKSTYHPRNTSACVQHYGKCDYLAVCSGAARIDDETLFTIRPKIEPIQKETT